MESGYIGVLDSGIGGISVLTDLIDKFPFERFIYLGDNDNAPYGEKSSRELLSLSISNLLMLKGYNLKAVVVACNTLSVSILNDVREFAGVPVFPIFPPVERCIRNNEKTLLLCTPKTAEVYNTIYKNNENILCLGFKDLVRDIERNKFDLKNVSFKKHYNDVIAEKFYNHHRPNLHFDTVILGCTHYSFIKNQIFNHLKPSKTISGNVCVVENLKKFIQLNNLQGKPSEIKVVFIGKNSIENERFFVEWANFRKKL